MLTVHALSKRFHLQTLFENVTFSVNAGERVGLIGPNGCGKSTLLRIIAGRETATSGHFLLTPSTVRIGYLAQGFEPDPTQRLGDLLHEVAGDPHRLEAELGELAMELAERPDDTAVQIAYDQTLQRLNDTDNGRLPALLSTFELDHLDPALETAVLSGGQKTRLSLVCLLLNQPDLLLLDEPTNHLDIDMLAWLESWLADFSGGVLLVSHDRTFLDNTVNRILDLDPEKKQVIAYPGNYTDYLHQYQTAVDKQWAAFRDQEVEIRRMKQDIARAKAQAVTTENRVKSVRIGGIKEGKDHYLRLAKKVAKKAKSREKKLDRYLDAADRVEKPTRSWQMKLELDEVAHLGKDVLTMDNLTVGYTAVSPLITHITHTVQTNQRIVLAGPNGSGKTTLLRTLTGKIPALGGHFRLGASVQLGVMTQEQINLPPEQNSVQIIQAVASMDETATRSFLHYFLFAGDEPLKPTRLLSYGQRARLALARLVAMGCNFLLLDEPINHLDIPSRERFEQALTEFEGTILAVVHDRYFIERFATEVWWVENGRLSYELAETPID